MITKVCYATIINTIINISQTPSPVFWQHTKADLCNLHHMPPLDKHPHQRSSLQLLIRPKCQSMLHITHSIQQHCQNPRWKVCLRNLVCQLCQDIRQCVPLGRTHICQLFIHVLELQVHQPFHCHMHIPRQRCPTRHVHILFIHNLTSHGRTLQQIQHPPHIASTQVQNGLNPILRIITLLRIGHLHQPTPNLLLFQRSKSKPRTPTLQRGYNLAHIITNQTKPCILGMLLNHPPQSKLSIVRHGIRLV
mmetsp:Transcript_16325/g.35356  ORF Transcript_16325/g.35356 Transcript_16325/m.35356 type:complete len:249 (-) Transcript_16325:262-1008(-)